MRWRAAGRWPQLVGVSLLCGIGFNMSLFIGLLAFASDPVLQDKVKIGILVGSTVSGLAGWAVLRVAPREVPAPGTGPPGDAAERAGAAPRPLVEPRC